MAKKKGFRWGFEWGKVASGGLMMLTGGGITLVGFFLGWFSVWAVVLLIAGFFTAINGLMGEDGVW
jgi:hypothetical protein